MSAEAGGFPRFFVITGGPGSGKSTLVEALRKAGVGGSEEAGRRIIKDQVAISGRALPWVDPPLFAEMMLALEICSYRALAERPGIAVFDRGIPDVIGYLRLSGLPVPGHMARAAALFRYNRRVFVTPPWPEIFRRDAERKQSPEEAERTYDAMVWTYGQLGYELREVPRAPVDVRLRFVLAEMSSGTGGC